MVERPIGEATLDVCAECKGVWVDSGELEEAARTLRGEMPTASSSGEMSGLARAATWPPGWPVGGASEPIDGAAAPFERMEPVRHQGALVGEIAVTNRQVAKSVSPHQKHAGFQILLWRHGERLFGHDLKQPSHLRIA